MNERKRENKLENLLPVLSGRSGAFSAQLSFISEVGVLFCLGGS